MSTDDFYYQLEKSFRGSEELISRRLQAYEPVLEAAKSVYHGASCVDLGCGRGEWLKLLEKHEFTAVGVDSDPSMVAKCEALQLGVVQGDALNFLSKLEAGSQAIISGFHIAEHLDFEVLKTLFVEAHRALKPGGILLLETPNPENLTVASLYFYLDPTHKSPLPPALMSFLAKYYAFARYTTWGLNHDPDLESQEQFDLDSVLRGVSPDYTLIAQKAGNKGILEVFDQVFFRNTGMWLNSALQKHERALTHRFTSLDEEISLTGEKASAAEEKANAAEEKANAAEEKANAAEEKANAAEAFANSAESARELAEAKLLAIQRSAAWRITYPMRLLADILIIRPTTAGRRVANRLLAGLINAFEAPLRSLMKFCMRYPRITALAEKSLSRLPFLRSHLTQILSKPGTNHGGTEMAITSEEQSLAHVSPRARQIHADLKAAMKSNR